MAGKDVAGRQPTYGELVAQVAQLREAMWNLYQVSVVFQRDTDSVWRAVKQEVREAFAASGEQRIAEAK